MSRKDQIDKEKQALLNKNFVKNNPIFTNDHVMEFYDMFVLYADPRTKRVVLRDILVTAKTLGLNNKYSIIFRALEELADVHETNEIDFETFINELTEKMGNPFDQNGRQALFQLIDLQKQDELTMDDLKIISNELRFNLTEEDIKEVIHNVAGYEATTIPYEKFESYLKRKIQRRQAEMDLLK